MDSSITIVKCDHKLLLRIFFILINLFVNFIRVRWLPKKNQRKREFMFTGVKLNLGRAKDVAERQFFEWIHSPKYQGDRLK